MQDKREFSHHEECPSCESSDGFAVYSDGITSIGSCFVCGISRKVDNTKEISKGEKMSNFTEPKGLRLVPDKHRGLTKDTLDAYGWFAIGLQSFFPYYSKDQALLGYKVRDAKYGKKEKVKDPVTGKTNGHFSIWGGITKDFFGTKSSSNRRLLITTGEYDAMAAHQLFSGKSFTCISIPNGDRAGLKSIEASIKWLDSFEEVYLAFDNDESGSTLVDLVKKVYGRAKVVRMDKYKDVNECLLAGDGKYFTDLVWAAQKQMPEYLSDGVEAARIARLRQRSGYVSTGIEALDGRLDGGIRPGNYIVVMGATGKGKTSLSVGIVASYIQEGKKVLYQSTEEGMGVIQNQVCRAVYGKDLYKMEEEDAAVLSESLSENLIFLEPEERFSDDEFRINVKAAMVEGKYDLLVIDTVSNDIQSEISEIGGRCRVVNELIRQGNFACILVTHVNRASQQLDKEGNEPIPSIFGAFGSSSVERLAHLFFGVQRTKAGTLLHILKARGFPNALMEVPIPLQFNAACSTFKDILSKTKNVGKIYDDSPTDLLFHSDCTPVHISEVDNGSPIVLGSDDGHLGDSNDDNSGNREEIIDGDILQPVPSVHVPDGAAVCDTASVLCSYPFYPEKKPGVVLNEAQQAMVDLCHNTEGELVGMRGLSSEEFPLELPPGNNPATWTPEQVLNFIPEWGASKHGKYQAVGEQFRARGYEWGFEIGKSKDGYPMLVKRGMLKTAAKMDKDELYSTGIAKRIEGWLEDAKTKGESMQDGRDSLPQSIRTGVPQGEPEPGVQHHEEVHADDNTEIHAGLPIGGASSGDEGSDRLNVEGQDTSDSQTKPRATPKLRNRSDATQRSNQREIGNDSRGVVPEKRDTVDSSEHIQIVATTSTSQRLRRHSW